MLTEERVLIIAPLGQDAEMMAAMLQAQGISTGICCTPRQCVQEAATGAGALVLTEEALELPKAADLLGALRAQPAWSEIPLIILTRGGESRRAGLFELAASAAGAVTLLERPMSAATLLRSVEVALKSRRRQYQVRDLLTEQQRQKEELRRSEHRLALLAQQRELALDAAKLGWWHYDPHTRICRWDDRFKEIFGVTEYQRPIDQILDRIHPEDRARVWAAVETALNPEDPRPYAAEYRIFRGDGSLRWIAAHGLTTVEGEGALRHATSLVGTVEDITDRREFQAELERLVAERTARLQELVNELEHFSYSITHDMRAPLRSMAGFAELAAELCGASSVEEQRSLLARISQSTARMDALITDALSYSEAVRKHLPLAKVDINHLLCGMLDSYPEFQAARAYIQVQSGIPIVFANEAGLTQCFSNLLNNAVKFAKPGETPRIRIWAERVERYSQQQPDPLTGLRKFEASGFAAVPSLEPGVQDPTKPEPWIRIWIEDEGIGISKVMRSRAFNMFSHGSTGHVGTGIGLALVRKVVDRMGGRVGVESEEGKGSRFWMEFAPAHPL